MRLLSTALSSMAFAVQVAACAQTYVDFKPYSSLTARGLRPVMGYAIVAYEGDIPALAQAGGEIVGTLDVSGNGYAGADDVRARAVDEAARVGGTHLLIAGESSSTAWVQITPDHATTTFSGNTATTTYTPGAQMPVTRHRAAYVVVRVPPERWLELPGGLRPVQGRHFKGDYPGQRRVAAAPGSIDTSPPEAALEYNWFCTANEWTTSKATLGMCFRSRATCSKSYEDLKQYGSTPCVPLHEATCFSSSKPGDTARLSCHPTLTACRSQRDYAFGQGSEILRECTLTR